MKKYITSAAVMMVAIIAGCGGGGGTTAATTVSATTTISGKVADGYLVGAQVFLDKNNNYLLDSGEPSAITGPDGTYTLVIAPGDVGKYPVVAVALAGRTIDLDSPGQALQNSYVLCLPKDSVSGSVSNFISPMSTQVRELMETGKYSAVQQAMEDLRLKTGMPVGTNMLSDYMASNNAAMHSAARNMVTLMSGQTGQIMGSGANATVVDVNRYRAMVGTIFSNMSSIRGTNAQTAMDAIRNEMTPALGAMPMLTAGQPYRNMSTVFRSGVIGRVMGSIMGRL